MRRLFICLTSLLLLILACRPGANARPSVQVKPTVPPDTQVTVSFTLSPTATLAQPTSSQSTALPQPIVTPKTAMSPTTLDTCKTWLQAAHTLDYPNHGCAEHTDVLNAIESQGGSVVPLGDKFFIARFPDGWDQLSDRKLIITLHGSGGCA